MPLAQRPPSAKRVGVRVRVGVGVRPIVAVVGNIRRLGHCLGDDIWYLTVRQSRVDLVRVRNRWGQS